MGIIVSIPQSEGLLTTSPSSLTTSPTSYALETPQTSVFGVAATIYNTHDTGTTSGTTATSIQTDGALPTEVTDVISIHSPTSPESRVTITTYLSTATVTSKTYSTQILTTTATVQASKCSTNTTAASKTFKSAVPTRVHTGSILGTPTHSRPPAVMSEHGTSSINGPHRSVAVSSQSSSSISVLKPKGTISSIAVSGIGASRLSSLSTGDLKQKSHDLSPVSRETAVTIVRTKIPAHATSISRFGRGFFDVREPSAARNEGDHMLSSSGRSIAISYKAGVTGTKKTFNNPSATDPVSSMTSTKTEKFTKITVFETTLTHHTTTITTTILPLSCHTSILPSSTPTSSALCTSAIPNPHPPANDTCAEDGLLEYSNSPQPPDTLEGCATACLADTSCLSFTFIPSEGTCYTSLYPLADSAFAGTQEYHVYNYDRDCYSCSS